MSKRFKSTLDEETMSIMPYLVSDNEEECFYNLQGCVDLLNTMSDEIEEVEISIKLFEDDVQIKDKEIEEQQATISQLKQEISEWKKENEKLQKQIQNYERLIDNAYVGEEETLDGFVGKYVIWENELQKYKNKNEMIDDG